MNRIGMVFSVGCVIALVALTMSGCVSTGKDDSGPSYAATGQKQVRVSLNNRAVYVYDATGKSVFVSAVAIGTPQNPTPTGDFKAFNKIAQKRSGSYGFHVSGSSIRPGKRSTMPSHCRYVGYPMPHWVEFKSGYGFHAGAVWPSPRSHGCLRIHKTLAKEFFQIVDEGTAIHIAHSLPEDHSNLGKKIWRPTDYALPNSPGPVLISNAPFTNHNVIY